MQIKPLQDWVVVQPDDAEERSHGGLIIPDSAQQTREQGRVIAVGEGKWVAKKTTKKVAKGKEEKTFVKTVLKPGDHILYEQYAARTIEVDGGECVLVREEEVLGLLV